MIAVFVRRNHPATQPQNHGYSALFVEYDGHVELDEVTLLLMKHGLPEPMGHPFPLYGGYFDLAGTIDGTLLRLGSYVAGATPQHVSVGDHRYIGHYTAQEVIQAVLRIVTGDTDGVV